VDARIEYTLTWNVCKQSVRFSLCIVIAFIILSRWRYHSTRFKWDHRVASAWIALKLLHPQEIYFTVKIVQGNWKAYRLKISKLGVILVSSMFFPFTPFTKISRNLGTRTMSCVHLSLPSRMVLTTSITSNTTSKTWVNRPESAGGRAGISQIIEDIMTVASHPQPVVSLM
jgi:hypothetical protein